MCDDFIKILHLLLFITLFFFLFIILLLFKYVLQNIYHFYFSSNSLHISGSPMPHLTLNSNGSQMSPLSMRIKTEPCPSPGLRPPSVHGNLSPCHTLTHSASPSPDPPTLDYEGSLSKRQKISADSWGT